MTSLEDLLKTTEELMRMQEDRIAELEQKVSVINEMNNRHNFRIAKINEVLGIDFGQDLGSIQSKTISELKMDNTLKFNVIENHSAILMDMEKQIKELKDSLTALGGFSNEHAYDIVRNTDVLRLFLKATKEIWYIYDGGDVWYPSEYVEQFRQMIKRLSDATDKKLEGEKSVTVETSHNECGEQNNSCPTQTDSKLSAHTEQYIDKIREAKYVHNKAITESLMKPSEPNRTKELLDNMKRMEQAKAEALEPHREDDDDFAKHIENVIGKENMDDYVLVVKDNLKNLLDWCEDMLTEWDGTVFDWSRERKESCVKYREKYLSEEE